MKINIIQYLEETIKIHSKKVAVIKENRSITFEELGFRAKILGNEIRKKSGLINKPIAVLLPKSIESVISNLGVTYSGNPYMNLDVRAPDQRVQSIIELINPILVITNSENHDRIKKIFNAVKIININEVDFSQQDIHKLDSESLLSNLIDQDPYCIINTSGSTSTPKSVVLNHKSFIDFIEWSLETFPFSDNTKIGSLSPCIFDIYSYELCLMIVRGATLYLIPESFNAFPVKIIDYLEQQKINFIFWVPTIMVNIANFDLLSQRNLALETVWFAGEVFPTKSFNYWRKKLSQTTFVNMYGPIEITLDCTYFIVNREIEDHEQIPIGLPCKNTNLLILDENNHLINVPDVEGELCVRGTSLAMGYYNNPEGTRRAFVQNPLNKNYPELIYRTGDLVYLNHYGEIIYKGRKDSLIKHLGYRIELGEIEHVCTNVLKIVNNCCALYDAINKKILLVYESDSPKDHQFLRDHLSQILPKYMLPHSYSYEEQLPMNPNGKIDRLKIKEKYLN